MALDLSLKSSAVAGKLPQANQLDTGEIALNFNENGPFLTCKDSAGNIRRLNNFWVSPTAPASPGVGDPWVDNSGTKPALKVWLDATTGWYNLSSAAVLSSSIPELGENSIDASHLSPDAITTVALSESVVTNSKLAENSVDGRVLADGSVGSEALADYSVTAAALCPNSVSTESLIDGSVTSSKLGPAVVTAYNVAAEAIIEGLIASGAISTGKLQDGAVTGAKLSSGSVTADKIAPNSVIPAHIQEGSLPLSKIDPTSITKSNDTWTSGDTTVATTASIDAQLKKLAPKAFDLNDIPEGGLQGTKLADNAISGSKVAGETLDTSHIKPGAIAKDGDSWQASPSQLATTASVEQRLATRESRSVTTGLLADDAVTSSKLALGAVTEGHIQPGAVRLANIAPSVVLHGSQPWVPGATLPTSDAVERFVKGAPRPPVGPNDIEPKAIESRHLASGSVEATNIASGAVQLGHLASGTVQSSTSEWSNTDGSIPTNAAVTNQISAALADRPVSTENLVRGSVTEVILANQAVTSGHIRPGAVTATHLEPALLEQIQSPRLVKGLKAGAGVGAPSVNTADIFDKAVTTAKLADQAVTSTQIKDGSILIGDIDPNAVLTSSEAWVPSDVSLPTSNAVDNQIGARLHSFQVQTAQIADFSVTGTKLGNAAVTTAKLGNASVTSDKVGPGAIGFAKIDPGAVCASSETWTPTDSQLPTTAAVETVVENAVSNIQVGTKQLAAGSVTSAKLAPGAVVDTTIADGSVTFQKLAPSLVLKGSEPWVNSDLKLATTAAVEYEIDRYASGIIIDSSQIGDLQISTRKIADGAVTGVQIADLTILTQHIADQAIYGAKLAPATKTILGGIKVGRNLSITADGTLNGQGGGGGSVDSVVAGPGIDVDDSDADNPIVSVVPATVSKIGGIKVGKNLTVTADGTLSGTASGGTVDKIFSGPGISVDDTDPENPVVGLTTATTFTVGGVKPGNNLSIKADGTLDVEAFNIVSEITALQVGVPLKIRYKAFDPAYPGGIFTLYQDAPPPPPATTLMYYITVPNGTLTPPTFTTSSPHSADAFEPCPVGTNKSCGGVTALTSSNPTDMLWIAIPTSKSNVMWQYDNPPFTGIDTQPDGPTATQTLSGTPYTLVPFNGFTKAYAIYASYI